MENSDRFYSGTQSSQVSKRELAHAKLAREAAAEGFVLLKNEGLLPLETAKPAALFGGGAVYTVKGGIGSGDVNNRESISICRGMKEAGAAAVNEAWISDYEKRYENARNLWKEKVLEDAQKMENPFDAYARNPFSLPEGRKITPEDVKGACVAVYVISRIAGEGKDRRKVSGDYDLSEKEREDLLFLNEQNIPIVLILNAGAAVELTDILKEAASIQAVLNISLPGQEGGRAAADVLFGRALPGGRLTATWAERYEDYPSAENYSYLNGNLEREEYREGIYVGYRYFDSFGIQPLFPFGYGLSYTDFSIWTEAVQAAGDGIEVTVSVKNTGEYYCGREVVQVYLTLPQNGMAKEYQRLAGFAKTDTLQPGQSQRMTIRIEQKQLASYSEEMHAWVAERGVYGVWIGKHSRSLSLEAVLEVPEQTVLEVTDTVCPKTADFKDLEAPESVKQKAARQMAEAKKAGVPVIPFVPAVPVKPEEAVREAAASAYAQEQTAEELIPVLYGNITEGASCLGSSGIRVPGSAGETTERLEEKYKMRSLIMADGPAGLRLRQSYEADRQTGRVYGAGVLASLENGFLEEAEHHENADTYYQFCTAFPVGTALAQTWDTGLMYRFGKAIAAEMEEFHTDLWLAPGMNIQRNPLCGRSFEYYSEDPFLSGVMAAAVTAGVQENGKGGVTLKHFACNNQEDNRMGVDVCVSQRALREIYLRGFETAVKRCAPAAIMTAYNRINGVYAANSKDLCTTVARKEWGFGGVIMSDWNTTVPEDGSVPWKCTAAGNDIIMPGNAKDEESIRRALETGELAEEDVRSCAGRVLRLIERCMG